jgi:hypothetical protein
MNITQSRAIAIARKGRALFEKEGEGRGGVSRSVLINIEERDRERERERKEREKEEGEREESEQKRLRRQLNTSFDIQKRYQERFYSLTKKTVTSNVLAETTPKEIAEISNKDHHKD